MEYPVAVAVAEALPTLPRGKGRWYEIKFDGSPDIRRCLIRAGQ
ncbi:hypothetical protein [Streptomyces sp. NPDC055140]